MDTLARIHNLLQRANQFSYNNFALFSERGFPQSLKSEYVSWKAEAAMLLNRLCGPMHPIYKQFEQSDEQNTAVIGWGPERFEQVQGYICGALQAARAGVETGHLEDPSSAHTQPQPLLFVRKVCERFHQVAVALRRRRQNRPTLNVADEYDVQDLLHALLKIDSLDVRPEEWTPSYAGGSSRMDFLLKGTGIVVEVKKTRQGLADRELGDELLIDVGRYRAHLDCKLLVCFIYDPEELIVNPQGLVRDLSLATSTGLAVEVIISPSRA